MRQDEWWLEFVRVFLEDMFKEGMEQEDLHKMTDWWENKLDRKGMTLFLD